MGRAIRSSGRRPRRRRRATSTACRRSARLRRPSTCEGRARHEAELDLAGRLGALLALTSAGLWGYTALSSSGAESCRVSVCIGEPWPAPALLTASAAGAVLLGCAVLLLREGRATAAKAGSPAGPAVALTAVGVVVAAAGGAVGIWMTWVGIGVAAVGVAGVLAARRRPQ